jgi:hypothetical protein
MRMQMTARRRASIVLAIKIRIKGLMPYYRPAIAMVGVALAAMVAADVADQQNAIPLTHLAQNYAYHTACPYRYYFTCWSDSVGAKHCGCRPGWGFYLFRYN